jgi:hypothetical protein
VPSGSTSVERSMSKATRTAQGDPRPLSLPECRKSTQPFGDRCHVANVAQVRALFLTVAGMIAVKNIVVIGTTCGLFAGMVTSNPMGASPIAGVIGAATSLVFQFCSPVASCSWTRWGGCG